MSVCSSPGCPNLAPCPAHAKHGGHWSRGRDRNAQARFRRAVLTRDRHTCRRCGHHDPTGRTLEAHHTRPGYDPAAGVTVCSTAANGCHRELDPHAR